MFRLAKVVCIFGRILLYSKPPHVACPSLASRDQWPPKWWTTGWMGQGVRPTWVLAWCHRERVRCKRVARFADGWSEENVLVRKLWPRREGTGIKGARVAGFFQQYSENHYQAITLSGTCLLGISLSLIFREGTVLLDLACHLEHIRLWIQL